MIEMQPCAVSPKEITIIRRLMPEIADQLYFEPHEVHHLAVNRIVRFSDRYLTHTLEERPNAV